MTFLEAKHDKEEDNTMSIHDVALIEKQVKWVVWKDHMQVSWVFFAKTVKSL